MRGLINRDAAFVAKAHEPAANTAAVITLAAEEGVRHVVDRVSGGYKAAPTNVLLTIQSTVHGTTGPKGLSPNFGNFPFDYQPGRRRPQHKETSCLVTVF